MTITDKLNKLLILAATKKLEFNLEKGGENNTVDIDNEQINIKIADYEDKQLGFLLDEKITYLENLLK